MKFKNYKMFFKILLSIPIIFIFNGCHNYFLLNPHGDIARKESSLILISFIMMLLVIIPVIFMTFYFSLKYCEKNINREYKPNWSESKKIEIIVWSIPICIVFFLSCLSWKYSHQLDPKKPIFSQYRPIKIDVIALDWRWLFIYPDYHIATLNQITFPTNRPIIFRITSNSVMNSFFIPSLGSQIYAMPGMITKLNLISNDPGKYKGISSNYSGHGFSQMKFTAISLFDSIQFEKWIKKIKNSSKKLDTIDSFNQLSTPNINSSVEYFSTVKENLFQYVVNKYTFSQHSMLNQRNIYNISRNYVCAGKLQCLEN